MEMYRYDKNTGEFLYPVLCQRNPLNHSEFFPVECAVSEQPPEPGKNQTAVFKNNGWQLIADHRGKTTYNKTDKSELKITELGDIPDTHTELKPGEFEKWQAGRWVADTAHRHQTLCLRYCTMIDSVASERRRLFISGDSSVIAEYTRAEQAAIAYQQSGYSGDVPAPVNSHAVHYGVSPKDAAKEILNMAAFMSNALDAVRDARLGGKQAIKALPKGATEKHFKTASQPWIDKLKAITQSAD